MNIQGNYNLNIWIGDTILPVTSPMIETLTITQDIDCLVPTFRLGLADSTRQLGDILPYDKDSNNITFDISRTSDLSAINTFKFVVKRRTTIYPDENYEISGILNIPKLLTDRKSRAFTGNIKSNLETIAYDDLLVNDVEVGASLNYNKTIIQPLCTDAVLLNYLKDNLIGKNSEAGYYCFVKVINSQYVFVFKSLNELLLSPVKYKFIIGHKPYLDNIPVVNYEIFDNSQLISDLGAKNQGYVYFDYEKGEIINNSIDIVDCPTLSELILIDSDKDIDTPLYTNTGRSNSFTEDFEGKVRSDFYIRETDFINMWIDTWGLENICPGDVVQVTFAEALSRGNLFVFQHSGNWLVKRVIHNIGSAFLTKLLLCRAGIDTDISNSLLKSEKQIKK